MPPNLIKLYSRTTGLAAKSMSTTENKLVEGLCVSLDAALLQKVKAFVPKLNSTLHKGQCGRIGVFGGCNIYTGAPYFAAISALKCGADVVHIVCTSEAGPTIKSYSPELIVHPILDNEYAIEEIDLWLPKFHGIVIGPGLGRSNALLAKINIILEKVMALKLPMVIDADALWHLANHNPFVIRDYERAILTPNKVEFNHLVLAVLKRDLWKENVAAPPEIVVKELAQSLGGVTVILKGACDIISNGVYTEMCSRDGCPRRCGGQGDVLSGVTLAFLIWVNKFSGDDSQVLASWAGCRLTRAMASQAFALHGRATITTHIIEQLPSAFSRLFESETCI